LSAVSEEIPLLCTVCQVWESLTLCLTWYGFLGGELGKSMYNGIKDKANWSSKKAGEIYSDTQNGGLEKSNDIQD